MLRWESRIEFWRAVAGGASIAVAAGMAGVSAGSAKRWFRDAGGVIPVHRLSEPTGRLMSYEDRLAIGYALGQGSSIRKIAALIGRPPSTVSREVRRNTCPRRGYVAHRAQNRTEAGRQRPQLSKIAQSEDLRVYVQKKLTLKWSPEQISRRLAVKYPGQEAMQVSHETIYRTIYVQARGTLKRDLVANLRTGRSLRKPRAKGQNDGRVRGQRADLPNISTRPAEVEDRAIPGHWEGDLIVGKDGFSQIGTLVERTTRFCLLLHLPDSKDSASVVAAMIAAIQTLPEGLMKTLTWDQGTEMTGAYTDLQVATALEVYFADPHSPWQRGSNENMNGLLRQYFPKGTDLSEHSREHLDFVQNELNGRPRKTLGWDTPAEAFEKLLLKSGIEDGVATTT